MVANREIWDIVPPEEERQLFADIQNGKKEAALEAMSTLVRRFEPLVRSIAAKFARQGVSYEDLVSEGRLGLMEAAKRYDPDRGARFSTYSAYWISHYVRRARDSQGRMVHIPCGTAERVRKIHRILAARSRELGREPTDQEVADKVGIQARTVRRLRFGDVLTVPFASGPGEEQWGPSADTYPDRAELAPDHLAETRDAATFLRTLLRGLGQRENRILCMYYGLDTEKPRTLAYIGKRFGVSSERVRQIRTHSLNRLKALAEQHLEDLQPILS